MEQRKDFLRPRIPRRVEAGSKARAKALSCYDETVRDHFCKNRLNIMTERNELNNPYGSAPDKSETELLEMAVFWMRKSQDYSPPRNQDVGRMLECANVISHFLKQNND